MCLEYALGLHTTRIHMHPVVTNFFAVIPIAILVHVLRLRRARSGGTLTWKHALTSGMIVSALTSAVAPLSLWAFARFVNPGFFATFIAEGVRQGHDQQEMERYFNLTSYIVQGTIGPLVMGLITTVVITLVLRRRPSPSASSPVTA